MGSSQYDLIDGDADVGAVCGGKVDIYFSRPNSNTVCGS